MPHWAYDIFGNAKHEIYEGGRGEKKEKYKPIRWSFETTNHLQVIYNLIIRNFFPSSGLRFKKYNM